MNQGGPASSYGFGIKPEFSQSTWFEVLHEHIGAIDDLVGGLEIIRILQI